MHSVFSRRCNGRLGTTIVGIHRLLSYSASTSTSTSTSRNDSCCSYSDYLVGTLGLTRQQADSISNKLTRRRKTQVYYPAFVENASSVVDLFRQLGFDDTLVRNIVFKEPRLLASNVERTLKPKIRALQDHGFSPSHLIRVVSRFPSILFHGLELTILPAVQILTQVMGPVSNVVSAIERLNDVYFRNVGKCLLPKVALLTKYGVPIELIREQLLYQPGYFVQNTNVCRNTMMAPGKKMGIARHSPMGMNGFNLISGMSEEAFQSKCQMFRSFGWKTSDIERLIKKNERRFAFSHERIEKNLDFLMNKLLLNPAYLISHDGFLTWDLEKRIVPRHQILQILKENFILREYPSIYNAIETSEPRFLKRFVLPFREVHKAYAKLASYCLQMLTQETEGIISTTDSCVTYLVTSLGFSRQQSRSISTKLTRLRKNNVNDFDFVANANSVITAFHNLGLDKALIRNIVSKEPHLLASKVARTLERRIRILQEEFKFNSTRRLNLGDQMLFLKIVGKCNSTCYQRLVFYYTCATSTNGSYANYLGNSLGFSQQQALSVSAKLTLRRKNKVIDSEFVENANSVVTLFRNLGFDNTLLRNIMSRRPVFLASKVNKTLKPKIRALQDEDFSRSDIVRVISRHPEILWYGLDSTILPAIHNLKQVMGSVANVVNTIEKLRQGDVRYVVKCLLPNVAFLNSSYRVLIELIRKQLLYEPRYFMQNPEVFNDIVMRDGKNLGMSKETFQSKRQKFTSFAANPLFLNYLVNHLGFSHHQALSICTKLSQQRKKVSDSEFVHNAMSVVTFFGKHGFDDTHIRNIVSKHPQLLASKVDRILKPIIRALQDEDFSASDIVRVISRRPSILLYRLESIILPAIHILKQVFGSVGSVVNAIERCNKLNFRPIVRFLMPNVTLLSIYGVPVEKIRKHILYKPMCYVRNPKVFKDIVMQVENKLGVSRDSPHFLYGINLLSAMTEECVESKCQILQSFGWAESDVRTFLKKNGSCFTLSDELLRKKLDFLMNELQLKPAYLTSHNAFLTCSLEKRVVPRRNLLLILKEKGILKDNPSIELSFYSAITMSELAFLKRFVLPFKEVHQDYAKLTDCSLKIQTEEGSVKIS